MSSSTLGTRSQPMLELEEVMMGLTDRGPWVRDVCDEGIST